MALKQTFPVANVAQAFAAPVESCRDEVIFFTVTRNGDISLYVFSGENENFTKVDVGEYAIYFQMIQIKFFRLIASGKLRIL